MSNKLPVTIIITTFDKGDGERYKLLYQTVKGLVDNLSYENLHWIITDDSTTTPQVMIDTVSQMIPSMNVSFFNTSRRGVGFSKNSALKEAFKISPVTLIMEDDWLLTQKLDLLPHVQLLLDHTDIGMIRMGFLGGEMTARRMDYGSWEAAYWWLLPDSGFYTYSGQISLRHERYYKAVGWHDENCTPGQEEESMCWRYCQLETNSWTTLPDGYNIKNIDFTTHDVRVFNNNLQIRLKSAGIPKILWPCSWGTTFNASPFKNIGLGNSVNNVAPGT